MLSLQKLLATKYIVEPLIWPLKQLCGGNKDVYIVCHQFAVSFMTSCIPQNTKCQELEILETLSKSVLKISTRYEYSSGTWGIVSCARLHVTCARLAVMKLHL